MLVDGFILTAPPMDRTCPGPLGVRTYKRSACFEGYTLFSSAFGYTEYLIDLNGMVVHTWPITKSQLAELRPDGNLLVDHYGSGLDELAPDGTRVWNWEGPYHHDFDVQPNGNLVFLISRHEPPRERFYPPGLEPGAMRTDVVVEIGDDGEICWEFSFGDHIQEICDLTGLRLPLPHGERDGTGRVQPRGLSDWAHTNTIEILQDTPLGRRDPRFRAGNLLFSFRALDIIGIIDRGAERIAWAWGLGTLDGQHQPTMLPDGNILIFDNGTYRGNSVALEIDPVSGNTVWCYEDGDRFYSPYRSGVQRLPNGNTLICESDAGRIFEVTSGCDIVWDYYSPFLGQGPGNQGRHVYRATRYTADEVAPLFRARTEDIVAVADTDRRRLTSFQETLRYYQKGLEEQE